MSTDRDNSDKKRTYKNILLSLQDGEITRRISGSVDIPESSKNLNEGNSHFQGRKKNPVSKRI